MDDHRRSNWTPYVYRTTDYGKSWTSLVTKDIQGYAHTIEQIRPIPISFLGTEFVLVAFDAGKSWRKWKHGVPTVAVRGLQVHPRDYDLVVATHGRAGSSSTTSSPPRHLERDDAKPLHLCEVPDAQPTSRNRSRQSLPRDASSAARTSLRRAPHLLAESAEPPPSRR